MKSIIRNAQIKRKVLDAVEKALDACAYQHEADGALPTSDNDGNLNVIGKQQPNDLKLTLEFFWGDTLGKTKHGQLVCVPIIHLGDVAETLPAHTNTIEIMANGVVIGAVQTLTVLDDTKEYPTIELTRIRFSRLHVGEAFGDLSCHPKSQKLPLQVSVKPDGMQFQNVWLTSTGPAYLTYDWIILTEAKAEAKAEVEAIHGVKKGKK